MSLALGIGIGPSMGQGQPARAYQAESTAFFARIAGAGGAAPSVAQKNAYDSLIVTAKSVGWWSKLDLLYLLFTYDGATALLNVKQNAFNLTKTGTPAFAVGLGYTGQLAGAAFLNTGFTPSTAGGQFALNSAHMGAWVCTATGNSNIAGGNNGRLQVNGTAGTFGGRVNDGTTSSNPAAGDVLDHILVNRTASGALSRWRGGVKYSTDTSVSTSLDSAPWTICGNDGIGAYSDEQLGAFHAGSALTDLEIMSMRQALKQFATDIGSSIVFARNALDSVNVGTIVPGSNAYTTQNASQTWSYLRDGPHHRFELRDGDLVSASERTEIVSGTMYPNNTDLGMAWSFSWSGAQSGIWHVQGQMHGPDSGGTTGYSPAIAIDVNSNGVVSLETNYDIGAGQVAASYAIPGVTLVAGQVYNVVINFKANAATPGTSYATVYINGVAVLTKTNIDIGFSNDGGLGFYNKIGVYRDAATGNTTEIWNFWNLEVGAWASLSGRVASPLPVYS